MSRIDRYCQHSHFYRLLDTTKTRKSMNQLVSLLQVLDCSVDLLVADKEAVV